jgi:hypothetical protein
MAFEWSPAGLDYRNRWDIAEDLTAHAAGLWIIRPGWAGFGWRLTPRPGSGYAPLWALTLRHLWRRLAAATPGAALRAKPAENTHDDSAPA